MPKKSRRKQKQKKWTRATIINYVVGALVAVTMVGSSLFVFGSNTPTTNQFVPTSTPFVTSTTVPVIEGVTPTANSSTTPAAIGTPAATTTP